MNIFQKFKRIKEEPKPIECHKLKKAENIAQKYSVLENCCSLLSSLNSNREVSFHEAVYSNGWKISTFNLKEAGVDIDCVYAFIKELVAKKKQSIECELIQLNL